MDHFDVAIVGAGPAGSSSAISLARKGYSVILLDKSLFPREKLCGDFLNPINWPIFEYLSVADELLSLEHDEITAFRITSFFGAEASIRFPVESNHSFGLGLRRSYLDHLLLRQAEKAGAAVRQGLRATALSRESGGWSINLGNHSTQQSVRSTFLIGADGRNSWVAHRLGLAQSSERRGNCVAFQIHLQGVKGLKGEVQIHLFPGGYGGLVGLGEGTTNLCLTLEREKVRKDSSLESIFDKFLYRNPYLTESLTGSEVVGTVRSSYPVYFSPRRFYGDGFLLVGDAARVTEPVTGEGVYFALRSGELAAEAIDRAFSKRDFSAQQFSNYQRLYQRAFSFRQGVNRLIRALIYRSSLLTPLIRLSSKISFPVGPLVNLVCGTGTAWRPRN